MSKIGKLPVQIPKGVNVEITDGTVRVKGPKGELAQDIHKKIEVVVEDNKVVVKRMADDGLSRSLHGLTRALVQNLVTGVSEGFSKTLEMVGVGYRAEMQGTLLVLSVGHSHPFLFKAPEGLKFEVIPKENKIIVSGIDKQLVGAMAAEIRRARPPEPYKGKGIKYIDEQIRRKAGKAAGA